MTRMTVVGALVVAALVLHGATLAQPSEDEPDAAAKARRMLSDEEDRGGEAAEEADRAVPRPDAPDDERGLAAIAVPDFANRAKHTGRFYEVRAADALQLALAETAAFDPLPRHVVRREVQARGLVSPLDAAGAQQLGAAVAASLVARGAVEACGVEPTERRCAVRVRVEVLNADTGATLGTFEGRASKAAAEDQPETLESLVDQAFVDAAAKVAEAMAAADLSAAPPGRAPRGAKSQPPPDTEDDRYGRPKRDRKTRRPGVITLAEHRARQAREGGAGTVAPGGGLVVGDGPPADERAPADDTPPPAQTPPAGQGRETEDAENAGRIVRGIVLTALPEKGRFLVSLGHGNGAHKGMELSLFRRNDASQPYGKLRIVEVQRTHSTAVAVGRVTGVERGDPIVGRLSE